jgi:hypothetical protein
MTRELERAIADACLGAATDETLASNLRGFLETRGVAAEDVDAIVTAPHRLAVYRSLVRNGLEGVVIRMLPRTRMRMNAACEGRFDLDMARFFEEVGPRTHYLRDVPHELFAWARARWASDPGVPGYLPDLAAYELAGFAVAAAESPPESSPGEVAPDRPLALHRSTRVMTFGWAVHELAAGEQATDVPTRRDVHLLAYRDAGHAVRWLDLSPLAAGIVRLLLAGETLQSAVSRACEEHGTSVTTVATDVALLLSDLGERGVLLGSRPA